MNILLNKFGTLLNSRPSGKEALMAFRVQLSNMGHDERLVIDFVGVSTFTPSWADDFLTPLFKEYGARVELLNTENPSVKATLDLLSKIARGESLVG